MNNKFFKLFISLLIFALPIYSYSQQGGAIKGFVYDKETGTPCVFANIHVVGKTKGLRFSVYRSSHIEIWSRIDFNIDFRGRMKESK